MVIDVVHGGNLYAPCGFALIILPNAEIVGKRCSYAMQSTFLSHHTSVVADQFARGTDPTGVA
jgi:hypothetical protein